MKQAADAPVWYGTEQADAWADGYNSALEEIASPASTSPCLNCGDPSSAPFCGTCREMGCVGEKPSLPVKNAHAAEAEASAGNEREALRPFAAVAAAKADVAAAYEGVQVIQWSVK
ncbi:hypothetical protein ACVWZK_006452 [Bradyrhizobium sp. GM0.4]